MDICREEMPSLLEVEADHFVACYLHREPFQSQKRRWMSDLLLEIKDVTKVFRIGGVLLGTEFLAVDHVSLSLDKHKPSILSIVGESGSGKTTLARIILKLHEPTSGDVLLEGKSVFGSHPDLDTLAYYRAVQPIFQNPFETFSMRKHVDSYLYDTALNLKIARDRKEARDIIAEALSSVGLDINAVAGKYPNQFSGGELQRISVARGLIPRPKLIVADEPVSMIDASFRMNIVNMFLSLKDEYNVSFIYITHDLSTAYYVSDYVAIMYRGNVVEYGSSDRILTNPIHPYTELLLRLSTDGRQKMGKRSEASRHRTERVPEHSLQVRQPLPVCSTGVSS